MKHFSLLLFLLVPFISADITNCPVGYKYYERDNHCIYYAPSSVKLNYFDAAEFCRNLTALDPFSPKTHTLLEIKDDEHLKLTGDLAYAEQNMDYWLGLNDINAEGQFIYETSRESFPVGFNPWSSQEPRNINGNEDCVAAIWDPNYHWWSAEDCLQEFSPICNGYEYAPKCPLGYDYVESVNRCYGILGPTTTYSSLEVANQTCRDSGGHLIEIVTRDHYDAINNLPQAIELNLDFYWLGMTDAIFEGEFIWVEARATTANFSNWSQGSVGELGGDPVNLDDDCAYMRWFSKEWVNSNCQTDVNNIMCETDPLY